MFAVRRTPPGKACMFSKILVANRGEIAIRAFRAAVEPGAKTVAVFPYEDRNSLHRLKADEAYQIGEPGHPVRAYLDVSEIIRVAESGADAIYPGTASSRRTPSSRRPPPTRHRLHRPANARARDGRQQGHRPRSRRSPACRC